MGLKKPADRGRRLWLNLRSARTLRVHARLAKDRSIAALIARVRQAAQKFFAPADIPDAEAKRFTPENPLRVDIYDRRHSSFRLPFSRSGSLNNHKGPVSHFT
jgi:hypothetical protein